MDDHLHPIDALRVRAQAQFDELGTFTVDFTSELTEARIDVDAMLEACEEFKNA